ncbi:MAG: cupin domain-containing protein [Paracoccaceae bacterium]|nr:cupin domain-containing protein [Paracoccaceae bacterium]
MSAEHFFNIDSPEGGIPRELAPGVATTVFPGDQAMISVVRIAPNTRGTLHHHPEEQWGYCIEGSGTRFQGDETVAVKAGDFWRTPGNVPHTVESGADGMVVLDVFAPPRKAYTQPGSGFATPEG